MENWKTNVRFRDLLKNYDSSADELKEIKRVKPMWAERFGSIAELKRFVPPLKKVKTLSQFNKWLGGVYDYCDANRIWVELGD